MVQRLHACMAYHHGKRPVRVCMYLEKAAKKSVNLANLTKGFGGERCTSFGKQANQFEFSYSGVIQINIYIYARSVSV